MIEDRFSLSAFQATVDDIPRWLNACFDVKLPPEAWLDEPWVTTGIGLSSGPARLLAAGLQLGRFRPLSWFAAHPDRNFNCVLFSQSMSPNARLAEGLSQHRRIAVTGSPRAKLGGFLNPERDFLLPVVTGAEHGLRLQSPVIASFLASLWLSRARPRWAKKVKEVPEAYARAFHRRLDPRSTDDLTNVVFVADADSVSLIRGLANKWAEATRRQLPVVVDILELAHGPLETWWEEHVTFLVFTTEPSSNLQVLLSEALKPNTHSVLSLRAQLDWPLSFFEFDALLNRVLVEHLKRHPPSPAKVQDGGLYTLGKR